MRGYAIFVSLAHISPAYAMNSFAKKLGPHCLLVTFLLQGCQVLHRVLSETIVLATGFMASVHLGTQDSPFREIMWLEIWAKKVMALAGNRGDYSHRSAYDETRRCLFAASRSPFVIAR